MSTARPWISGQAAPEESPGGRSRDEIGTATGSSRVASTVIVLVVFFLLALAVRLAYPVPGAFFDEFYHFVPAQSLLDGEGLKLGEGKYTRAKVWTHMVAGSMAVFGDTLWAARLPSVIFGSMLVALAAAWAYRCGGLLASIIAGGLLTLDPALIAYSTFCRFYSLQSACILLVMMSVWHLIESPMGWLRRGWVAAVTAGLILLAMHLQSASAVPLLAVFLWAVGTLGLRACKWESPQQKRRSILLLVGGVSAAVAAGLLMYTGGWLENGLRLYRTPPAWSQEWANDPGYYQQRFLDHYGWLWMLFPLLVIAAWAAAGRVAIYITALLAFGLLVHAFGATKGLRFITWTFPLIGILIALGLGQFLPHAVVIAARGLSRLVGSVKWINGFVLRAGGWAVVGLTLAMLMYYSPMVNELRSMFRGAEHTLNRYASEDWGLVRPKVEELLTDDAVLVSASGPRMVAYFGRLDYTILATEIEKFENGEVDKRTGAIGAATLEHLQAAVARHHRGVVVIEEKNWREPWGVNDEMVDWIESNMKSVDVPERSRVHVFFWDRPRDSATPPATAAADSRLPD